MADVGDGDLRRVLNVMQSASRQANVDLEFEMEEQGKKLEKDAAIKQLSPILSATNP